MPNVLAIVFWWFYIIICPVCTIAVLIFSVNPSKGKYINICRALACIFLLVLVFGTAFTSVGPMSWWFADMVSSRNDIDYYV
jgi:hypothetical protein